MQKKKPVRNSCSRAIAWVMILLTLLGWGVRVSLQMRKEQASKNSVHTLIATDELVRECETQHEATPFEPEDWCKGTREEDALNYRKCKEPHHMWQLRGGGKVSTRHCGDGGAKVAKSLFKKRVRKKERETQRCNKLVSSQGPKQWCLTSAILQVDVCIVFK